MRKRKISKSEDLSKNEGQSDDKESTNSGVMTRRKHSQCRVIPLSGERSKIDEGTFHKHLDSYS
ncbi:Protein-L-isoaspartate O-methyltransferase [Bienertia sinuspersici]